VNTESKKKMDLYHDDYDYCSRIEHSETSYQSATEGGEGGDMIYGTAAEFVELDNKNDITMMMFELDMMEHGRKMILLNDSSIRNSTTGGTSRIRPTASTFAGYCFDTAAAASAASSPPRIRSSLNDEDDHIQNTATLCSATNNSILLRAGVIGHGHPLSSNKHHHAGSGSISGTVSTGSCTDFTHSSGESFHKTMSLRRDFKIQGIHNTGLEEEEEENESDGIVEHSSEDDRSSSSSLSLGNHSSSYGDSENGDGNGSLEPSPGSMLGMYNNTADDGSCSSFISASLMNAIKIINSALNAPVTGVEVVVQALGEEDSKEEHEQGQQPPPPPPQPQQALSAPVNDVAIVVASSDEDAKPAKRHPSAQPPPSMKKQQSREPPAQQQQEQREHTLPPKQHRQQLQPPGRHAAAILERAEYVEDPTRSTAILLESAVDVEDSSSCADSIVEEATDVEDPAENSSAIILVEDADVDGPVAVKQELVLPLGAAEESAPPQKQKGGRTYRLLLFWLVAVVLMGSALMAMMPKSTSSTHPELHGGALATLTTQSPIVTNNSTSSATMVPTIVTNTSFLPPVVP
jgi:hypothetical protein